MLRDVQYAVRRLLRTPGFTFIAVASLALGIGANTAIFSLVNAILLRKPAVADAERLAEVYITSPEFSFSPFSHPDVRDLSRATVGVFEGFATSQLTFVPLEGEAGVTVTAAELVNGRYFEVLGLRPHLGRLFTEEEDRGEGAHPVVVLAYAEWRDRFGADPQVVGRALRLNGRDYTIVGVAPREYTGNLRGLAPVVYVPSTMLNRLQPSQRNQLERRDLHGVFVKGKLAPGVSLAQARAAVDAYTIEMKRQYPADWSKSAKVMVTPLTEVMVNPVLDRMLVPAAMLLLVVVGMVLLIACANLGSFLLARARDRQREVAIRLSLGAGRGVIVRQLLTESLLLALTGGAVGMVLARGLLHVLLTADLPVPIPITLDVSLDPIVLAYTLGASVLAGLLFGLAPALQATRADVMSTIKAENTGGGPRRRFALREVLVVAQVAGSLVLLATAGLFLRSFAARQAVDAGFGYEPTAMLNYALAADRYTMEQGREFTERLEAEVAALPGVKSVGIISNPHLNPMSVMTASVNVEGFAPPAGELGFSIDQTSVDGGYFDAAGQTILRGRTFDRRDRPDGEPVVIVNQAMADRFWPGADPVGRTFRLDSTVVRIVGVASTARIRMLGEEPRPFVYQPYAQRYVSAPTLLVRVAGDPAQTALAALRTARRLDPDVIVIESNTLERYMAAQVLPARLGATVFAAFAALALTLAIIGIYGVVSYAVARRTREVGIRLSLGANGPAVIRLMMRDGILLVLIGTVLGTALALAAGRLLAGFLFGVRPLDPVTLTAVPIIIVATGAIAAFIPARRASRVQPARVLGVE